MVNFKFVAANKLDLLCYQSEQSVILSHINDEISVFNNKYNNNNTVFSYTSVRKNCKLSDNCKLNVRLSVNRL